MSKDKGSKNAKKAPADKTKGKAVSSYKSENKSKYPTLDNSISKLESKTPAKSKVS